MFSTESTCNPHKSQEQTFRQEVQLLTRAHVVSYVVVTFVDPNIFFEL